ncbi:MAG: TIGR03435 family protein [Acidobacteriaceae bacterium]
MVLLTRFRIPSAKLRSAYFLGLAALALLLLPSLRAQQLVMANAGETLPSFEVAAIRPDDSGPYHTALDASNDSYKIENLTLSDLIMTAFGARSRAQVVGGPDKRMGERFDINARISQDDVARLKKMPRQDSERMEQLMLQALLADRFQLKVHNESRELPVFALIVVKGGPKFHASDPPPAEMVQPDQAAQDSGKPNPHGEGTWMRSDSKHAELKAYRSTMESLASILSNQSETGGRFVIDKTGLAGVYDYSLQWVPEYLAANAKALNSSADAGPAGPTLFTALEDQLGLKLESQKAPVEIVVVDHVEEPSAN